MYYFLPDTLSTQEGKMDSTDQEINKVRTEIIEEYRKYFALLKNYQEGNQGKIKQSLDKIQAMLHEYQQKAEATATSKLFHECYDTVLNENKWAIKTDFWSDR